MIGGGDTGSDCIGTSNRQGAASVTQLEIMPKPPVHENKALTWPDWPLKLRTSSSQEEGCERDLAVADQARASAGDGRRRSSACEWVRVGPTAHAMQEVAGSEFQLKADLVLLAMGFLGPRQAGPGGAGRRRRSIRAATSRPTPTTTGPRVDKIFACGDMRRGQSLVVWAIREGRQCARAVDEFLMGATNAAALTRGSRFPVTSVPETVSPKLDGKDFRSNTPAAWAGFALRRRPARLGGVAVAAPVGRVAGEAGPASANHRRVR